MIALCDGCKINTSISAAACHRPSDQNVEKQQTPSDRDTSAYAQSIYRKAMPSTQEADTRGCSALNPTRTLQEEGYGTPAITLTTYMMELPKRSTAGVLPISRKQYSPARTDETLFNRFALCYEQSHKVEHSLDHTKS